MTGYVRLEGVNIYANLGDTDQLSVVRGGSLFLKQAIENLVSGEQNEFSGELVCISQGASVGMYRTRDEGITEEALKALCQRVQSMISNHHGYRHLTFTLTHTLKRPGEGFVDVEKRLTALSRFQQLQQLTLAPDPVVNHQDQIKPCDTNGVRAHTSDRATEKRHLPMKGDRFSESVVSRFNAGIDNRRSLLRPPKDSIYTLTRNIEDLGGREDQGNLNNKIALVYFDGNSFGSLRDKFIERSADHEANYKKFDETMREQREGLLDLWREHVLKAIESTKEKDRYFTKQEYGRNVEHQLRFEPLLWGGDELLFVLPAWLGFEFLQFFYKNTQDWGEAFDAATLTHAGGVVFCKANTPIFRVRGIAQELADTVKEHTDGRTKNFYDLMALESVDFPAESLESYRNKTYGEKFMQQRPPLSAENIASLTELAVLLDKLPKSQIYQLCLPAQKQDAAGLEKGKARLKSLIRDEKLYNALESTLMKCFGEAAMASGWCWIWLREYWDYLEPLSIRQDDTEQADKEVANA